MDASDRDEFRRQLAVLCAGFDVPMTPEREEAYWIALQHMPLVMFARVVTHVMTEEEWARIPKPGQLWQVKRRMRAVAPVQSADIVDNWSGDGWDVAANRHLLAHIMSAWRERDKHFTPEETKLLVAYKHAWARDMREWEGPLSIADQKRCWKDGMRRAETDMLKLKAA